MAKIGLDTISSGYLTTAQLNNNFELIEDALNLAVLYRTNPEGETNQMNNLLDMNSNRIINLPIPRDPLDAVRLKDVTDLLDPGPSPALFVPYDNATSGKDVYNVQDALDLSFSENINYSNISEMKEDVNPYISVGSIIQTKGYHAEGDGGGASYIVAAAQSVDGYGDHVLASGFVALLQLKGEINAFQFGAVGDGVTDDGNPLRALFDRDNITIVLPPAVYALYDVVIKEDMKGGFEKAAILPLNRNNVKVVADGATLLWSGEDPLNTKEASLLQYLGDVVGATGSTNISVTGLTFDYKTQPSVRVNGNIPLTFNGVTGFEAANCRILSSWSAGIIYVRSNDGHIHHNTISDVLADGITGFGNGRNIIVTDNNINNTGDDSIAMTWYPAYTALDVGEPTIRTKNIVIANNVIDGSDARGIFIGGIDGGVVSGNTIKSTIKWGITTADDTTTPGSPTENPSATSTNSFDCVISDNVVIDAGAKSNETYGGIRNATYCTGVISGNYIRRASDTGIVHSGKADIVGNSIIETQNVAAVPIGKGAGIRSSSIPAAILQSSGHITNNYITETQDAPAILIGNSGEGSSLIVRGNTAYNCITSTSTVPAPFLIESGASNRIGMVMAENVAVDDRVDAGLSTILSCCRAEGGSRTIQYSNQSSVALNHPGYSEGGYSQNSNRAIMYAIHSFDPGTLAIGASVESTTLSVVGAQFGDRVEVAPPYNTSGYIIHANVVNPNGVKIVLTRATAGAGSTLGPGDWKLTAYRG